MVGPYIAIDSYTPVNVPNNETQQMTITFKNVGADATTSNTNVLLTSENDNVTITDGESGIKQCRHMEASNCRFYGKYPWWHVDGARITNCYFAPESRSAICAVCFIWSKMGA